MTYNNYSELQQMYTNGTIKLAEVNKLLKDLTWILDYYIRNDQKDMINYVSEKRIKCFNEICEWENLLKATKEKMGKLKPNEIQIIEFDK